MKFFPWFESRFNNQPTSPYTPDAALTYLEKDMSDKARKQFLNALLTSTDSSHIADNACRLWMQKLALEQANHIKLDKKQHGDKFKKLQNTLKLLEECKKEIKEEEDKLRIIISEPVFRK